MTNAYHASTDICEYIVKYVLATGEKKGMEEKKHFFYLVVYLYVWRTSITHTSVASCRFEKDAT